LSSIRINNLLDDSEPAVVVTFSLDRSALDYLGRTFVRASCAVLEEPDKDLPDFFNDTRLRKTLVAALLEFYEPEFIERIYKAVPGIQKLIFHTEVNLASTKKHPFYEKLYQAVQTVHLDFVQTGKNYGLTGPSYDQLSNQQS
jgi:hypothetical protein